VGLAHGRRLPKRCCVETLPQQSARVRLLRDHPHHALHLLDLEAAAAAAEEKEEEEEEEEEEEASRTPA